MLPKLICLPSWLKVFLEKPIEEGLGAAVVGRYQYRDNLTSGAKPARDWYFPSIFWSSWSVGDALIAIDTTLLKIINDPFFLVILRRYLRHFSLSSVPPTPLGILISPPFIL